MRSAGLTYRPSIARLVIGALFVAVLSVASAGAGPGPLSSTGFGPGIEDYSGYDGQDRCSPWAKPGVLAFRSQVLAAFPATGAGGIERDCSIGGQSEHKEGRAWDWTVNAGILDQRAAAETVFEWLTATDRYGNEHAMARRVGIMYMIFDRQIWFPGSGWRVYCKQKSFGCHTPGDKKSLRHPHTDHVHFSFTWDGAMKRTTYWKKGRSLLSGVAAPPTGTGYWLLAKTGGVAAMGSDHHGSNLGSKKPTVDLAAHPHSDGYWVVKNNGSVKAFGEVRHYGDAKGKSNKIAGIEATPSGKGYWLYAKRGRVFAFGDAPDLGKVSSGNVVAGLQTTPSGQGYWIATKDGSVFPLGDAEHLGDLAGTSEGVVAIEAGPVGGYWLLTVAGRVGAFGAPYLGDVRGKLSEDMVAMASSPSGNGYWLVGAKGKVVGFGDAPAVGSMRSLSSMHRTAPTVPPTFSPLD